MEDRPPVGSEGEDALETKPTAQGALSQQGPLRREPEGAGLLTAAQLGLLEAAQGLGVQGAGVGTERALRQLHGAIPGPGQQPAQAAVTRQELGAQVPAGGVEGPQGRAEGAWAPGVGMEPQGETEAGEGRGGQNCARVPCCHHGRHGKHGEARMVELQPSSVPPPQKAGHVGTVLTRLPPGQRKEAGA